MEQNQALIEVADQMNETIISINRILNGEVDTFYENITHDLEGQCNEIIYDVGYNHEFMRRNLESILLEDLYSNFRSVLFNRFQDAIDNTNSFLRIINNGIEELVTNFDPSMDFEQLFRNIGSRFDNFIDEYFEIGFNPEELFEDAKRDLYRLYGDYEELEEVLYEIRSKLNRLSERYYEEINSFKNNLKNKVRNEFSSNLNEVSYKVQQEAKKSATLDMDEEQLKTSILDLFNQINKLIEKRERRIPYELKNKDVILNHYARKKDEFESILKNPNEEERKQALIEMHNGLSKSYESLNKQFEKTLETYKKDREIVLSRFYRLFNEDILGALQGFDLRELDFKISTKEIYENRYKFEEYMEQLKTRILSSEQYQEYLKSDKYQKYLESKGLKHQEDVVEKVDNKKVEADTIDSSSKTESSDNVSSIENDNNNTSKEHIEVSQLEPVNNELQGPEVPQSQTVEVEGINNEFQAPAVVQPQKTEVAIVNNEFQAPAVVQPQIREVATVNNEFQAPAVVQPQIREVATVNNEFQAPAVVQPQIREVATVNNEFQAPTVVQPQIREVATINNEFQAPAVVQPQIREVVVPQQQPTSVNQTQNQESIISRIINNREVTPNVVKPQFTEKTFLVMEARNEIKRNANRTAITALIASGALFVAGFAPAALVAGGIAGLVKGANVYSNVATSIKREVVEYRLDRLATKYNGEFLVDRSTGAVSFDIPEDNRVKVQTELDRIFRNSERGVSNPKTNYELDYRGFSKVTIDNLGAAFEEYGGVRMDKVSEEKNEVTSQIVENDQTQEVVTTSTPAVTSNIDYSQDIIDSPEYEEENENIYIMAENLLNENVANLTTNYKEQNTLYLSQTSVNMFNGINDILYNNGVKYDDQKTAGCIGQLDEVIRSMSDNLMVQIKEGFKVINKGTVAVLNQINQLPPEEKEEKLREFSEIYVQRTKFDNAYLNCDNNFDKLFSDIAREYGLVKNSKVYDELKSYIDFNKEAVKQQFYNITNDFSNNNSMMVGRVMMQVAYADVYNQQRSTNRGM